MNNIANRSFGIFCVLFFLVNMYLNVEYVSAKNDEYQYDIQDENKKENISYEGVKENMEEVIDDQESVKSQEQIVEVDFRIKNYNDEEAYTEYILSDLPITKYAECKSYKDLLSKDCRVKVPYITNDNQKGVAVLEKGSDEDYELQEEIILNDAKHVFVSPKKVEEIIEMYMNKYYSTISSENEDSYFLLIVDFDNMIQYIKKVYVSKNYIGLFSWLIDRAFCVSISQKQNQYKLKSKIKKRKSILIKALYDINSANLLKCFSENY